MMQVKVVSVEEAGKLLSLGRCSAYKAVHAGELPSLKFGRRIVIPLAALEKLLQNPESAASRTEEEA